ncbi:trichohyalin-like protein 1 [Rhynchonycteris naso]
MPGLLRDILCVIETFHKYAREDGDEATLTCRQLKRLIQDEVGDILQPGVIHAVERNLNLLAVDSDGTISFDEFVLTIFNLLNLHYLDMKSLLNSESRQVSKPEEKPGDMDLQATSRTGWRTEETPPTQDKVVFSSEIESSAQLSPEERGYKWVDPQGDTKTHKLPGEESQHHDPENQHLEVDEQSQEVTQGIQATGDKETQIETNKPTAGSEQTSSLTKGEEGQDKEIPREGEKPAREQSGTKTRDQTGEQEGNLGTQRSPSEETTQRAHEDQEVAAENGVKEHSDAQEQPLQGKDKPSSACTDPPEKNSAWKKFQRQKSTDPKDDSRTAAAQELGKDTGRTRPGTKNSAKLEGDGRTPETREPLAPEKEHETDNLPVQGNSRNVTETLDVETEKKEERGSMAQEAVGQEESERKAWPLTLEDEAHNGKYQELQESSKEEDAEERSETQELSSEGEHQSHAETEREEARDTEEGKAQALMSSKDTPAAEGTSGARERIWELSTPENKSRGNNKSVTKTHDKPVEDDDYRGEDPEPAVTRNNKGSSETPNSLTPEDDHNSFETSDLPMQGDSQSQVDSLGKFVQESHNNNPDSQKQVTLGEKNKTQKAVGEENEQLTEEEEQPSGEECKIPGSGTKGLGSAVEFDEHPEAQTHLVTEKFVTLEEEDISPQGLTGEGEDQQNSVKKGHDSSVPQSVLEERTQRTQGPCSAERGTVCSSPLYRYPQEKILQQTDITKEEHQNQAQTTRVSGPELCNDQLSNEISGCPVFFSDS